MIHQPLIRLVSLFDHALDHPGHTEVPCPEVDTELQLPSDCCDSKRQHLLPPSRSLRSHQLSQRTHHTAGTSMVYCPTSGALLFSEALQPSSY